MKTLLLALLLSAMLFEQVGGPDDEPETPIYYVGVFVVVTFIVFLIKKIKASEVANSRRPVEPEELK